MMPYKVIMPPLLNPFHLFAAVNPVPKRKVQQLQQEVLEAQLEYFKMATKKAKLECEKLTLELAALKGKK